MRHLMQGITPGRVQVLGIAAPLPATALLPEPWTLSWSDGGWSWAGTGVSASLSATNPGDLLDAVARSEVAIEGATARPPAPWFGGFAFDATAPLDRWWEAFPPAWALVPRLLLGTDGRTAQLIAFARIDEDGAGPARDGARAALEQARARLVEQAGAHAAPRPPRLRPQDRSAWDALVSESLTAFESGHLRKVVLARALELEADAPLDVPAVRARMRAIAGPAVAYELRAEDGTTLLGASPERLFVLEGGRLETQALASSAAPGELDRLTGGRKEAREHAAVVESIRTALLPLSAEVEIGAAPEPLALGYVSHLRTPVRARLLPGVTPADVVRALHPTAAVGGTPRDEALAFLRSHERLARGWYAGAIGWLGPDRADLRVALRCALVRGSAARLFSGAGCVPGSTAEGEWQETAVKARFMFRAFGMEG
ncbi:MAG TPA: isochorismate synthase [Myxococcaceae bacterium]|nr:isochorismate synthase [Myxococcaceae bacterium]